MHRFIFLLISFIVAFLLLLTLKVESAEAPTGEIPQPTATQLVSFYFGKDAERMEQIFKCESGMKQFKEDGTVVMSPTRDFGIAQINEKAHDATAKRLGLDYKGSMIDNLKLAKYISEKQGINAWVCNRII
jgi:hypothetical protein